jgi:hypothetical protein
VLGILEQGSSRGGGVRGGLAGSSFVRRAKVKITSSGTKPVLGPGLAVKVEAISPPFIAPEVPPVRHMEAGFMGRFKDIEQK